MRSIITLLLGVTLLTACAGHESRTFPAGLGGGEALELRTMDGETVDVSARLESGRNVVLVFWQTWCESCVKEGPILARAAREHAEDLEFFGVVSGPDELVDEAEIREIVARASIPYAQVRDPDGTLSDRFGVTGTPTIVVLGENGEERFRGHHPPEDWRTVMRGSSGADGGDAPPGPGAAGGGIPTDPQEQGVRPEAGKEGAVERVREVDVMGTQLIITVQGADPVALDRAIDAAEAEIRRVEDLMTTWRPSPLTKLNDAAGTGPVEVPKELAAIIARGLEIGRLTGGAFDITYAAVGKLWSFKDRKNPKIPDEEAIRAALAHVDYRRVRVDPAKSTVELPAGFRIGLGGIAKGYGVDRAMKVLMKHGVKHGVINAGGDMKLLGRDEGKPWEVAIKHPRDRERVIAVLRFSNTCVVTSGDYERFFISGGRRYHHIIDPRTGMPSTGCMSASVVAPSAEFADALATAICVLGPKKGLELAARLKRVEALAIDLEGEVHRSAGLSRLGK